MHVSSYVAVLCFNATTQQQQQLQQPFGFWCSKTTDVYEIYVRMPALVFVKCRNEYLPLSLSLCISVCPSVRLSVRLSAYLFVSYMFELVFYDLVATWIK